MDIKYVDLIILEIVVNSNHINVSIQKNIIVRYVSLFTFWKTKNVKNALKIVKFVNMWKNK